MHRQPLLALIDHYARRHPEEEACAARIRDLIVRHDDCFERTCLPGHITASAWIVSSDASQFLLTHHRKLDRWLQLGGHADGQTDVLEVALREAQEESGMGAFRFVLTEGEMLPFDLDVHLIPARRDEPEHEHHDIRFLLVADDGQALDMSDESNDLRWFRREQLDVVCGDESVLRLGRKAGTALARPFDLGSLD